MALLQEQPAGAPAAHKGPPPSRSPRLRLRAFCCSPRWAPPGPLLRSPRAALAPLRVAGPGGARSGRRRFAAPLRRLRPRFARRARASLACPPLSRSATCAGLRPPRALAGPVCLRPRSRVAAGSLSGRPCCARPWALCSAWPRGGPLRARFRLRASGRSASPRPGGFGPGGSCARPPAAVGRLFSPPGAGAWAARGCAACCASPGLLHSSWGSPLPPPARPPRWGLPGARGPCGRLRPRSGSRFSRPSRGPPVARDRAPGAPFPAWLTVPKLSTSP